MGKLRLSFESDKGDRPRLTGWQLVVAIAVVGAAVVLTLLIAPPEAVEALVEPFLRTLGAS
jgi:hypothetical protein